jgi:hypothetical protein
MVAEEILTNTSVNIMVKAFSSSKPITDSKYEMMGWKMYVGDGNSMVQKAGVRADIRASYAMVVFRL